MSGRLIKLVLYAIVLSAIISYLFFLNPTTVQFYYAKNSFWSGPLALLEIITFFVGIFAALIYCLPIILRLQFSIASLKRELSKHDQHSHQLQTARDNLALRELVQAKTLVQKVYDAEPRGKLQIEATALLARIYIELGQSLKAQEILDKARHIQDAGAEILLLSADLNSKLGNNTAAFDACNLIVANNPKSIKAIKRIVLEAKKINRIDTAIKYQEQLLRLVSGEEYNAEQDILAELQLIKIEAEYNLPSTQKRLSIEELLRRHRNYYPAEAALAQCEADLGNTDIATKIFTKLFSQTLDSKYLTALGNIWLKARNPQRAFSALTQALAERSDATSDNKLVLIQLLLHLEMHDEAEKLMRELPDQFLNENENVQLFLNLETLSRNRKFEDATKKSIEYFRSKIPASDFFKHIK